MMGNSEKRKMKFMFESIDGGDYYNDNEKR